MRGATLIGHTRDEWVAHIDELFRIASSGEDIPEAALLFGWQGTPTAADFVWAKEQMAGLAIGSEAAFEEWWWATQKGEYSLGPSPEEAATIYQDYSLLEQDQPFKWKAMQEAVRRFIVG